LATNFEVISDALRLINVISEIDSPSAEQGTHGLRVLNDLMESWTVDGVELGWFTQTEATDDCPVTDGALLAVKTSLATTLATTYGATITAELGVMASNAYKTLVRNTVRDQSVPSDMSHMPLGEANFAGGYNIVTDE